MILNLTRKHLSDLTALYFVICSSVEKETLRVLGLPTGQVTPLRAILVSLAWSFELNRTQQVDLILDTINEDNKNKLILTVLSYLSIQKSSIVPVLFSISWKDLTVKGLVRFVTSRNSVSFSSSARVILFFLMTGSSLSFLTDLGTLGPATSGSDSTLAVSPKYVN